MHNMNNIKCTAEVVWHYKPQLLIRYLLEQLFAAMYVELTLNMSAQTIVSCELPSNLVVFWTNLNASTYIKHQI